MRYCYPNMGTDILISEDFVFINYELCFAFHGVGTASCGRAWSLLQDTTTHTQTDTHTHTRTHTYIYVYRYIYTHTHIYIYTHTHTYICIHHHRHVVSLARISWPSLATSPYRSSPRANLQGYIPYPHIAAVCMFELVVLLLLGHMWGSIGVKMCIYIYIYIHTHIYIYIHTHTYIYIYIYTHTHIYIYTHTHIYIYIYIYV